MSKTQTLTLQDQTLLSIIVRHNPTKRIFDTLFSFAVLVFFVPLFFLIALFIFCTSRGPIIYGHERIGRGGYKFKCFKFRTMYKDADKRLIELLASDPKIKAEWHATHKLKNDPRITSIGAFLRKTSLDELPQFWNVLMGDLSIVGPRPVVQEEIERHFGATASKILSVRPGITGIWQTSGRNNTTYAYRIKLDEQYIDNRSMLMDIKLILKTIPCMISRSGAY